MQERDDSVVLSPSDLNHFVSCQHLTALDLLVIRGLGIAKEKDHQAALVRDKGLAHERAWLEKLLAGGRQVVTIAHEGKVDWLVDAARTHQAMAEGVEVIYQGVFASDGSCSRSTSR